MHLGGILSSLERLEYYLQCIVMMELTIATVL
jgi:hypothetical protein